MKGMKVCSVILSLLCGITIGIPVSAETIAPSLEQQEKALAEGQDIDQQRPRVVGYLPDWTYSAYKNVDFGALTHLDLAFCNPDAQGNLFCYIPDEALAQIVEQAHASDVKVMAALGGFGGCEGYLPLLDTPEEMAAFNEKIMAYCEKHQLDGIDLDIELSADHAIWNYYGDWVASLRVLCDERGYALSTATAQWVAVKVTKETFSLFDFVNVMAYDNDSDPVSHASMEFAKSSLEYFHEQRGIAKERLVLGVPFYGRGYQSNGSLDWNSYESFSALIEKDPANFTGDTYQGIAYNGADTMREKAELAKGYGGMMIWEISQDAAGEYSLLAVIHEALSVSQAIPGDVDGDGICSIADAVMLQHYLVGSGVLHTWKNGDLNGDGLIHAADLVLLKRLLL